MPLITFIPVPTKFVGARGSYPRQGEREPSGARAHVRTSRPCTRFLFSFYFVFLFHFFFSLRIFFSLTFSSGSTNPAARLLRCSFLRLAGEQDSLCVRESPDEKRLPRERPDRSLPVKSSPVRGCNRERVRVRRGSRIAESTIMLAKVVGASLNIVCPFDKHFL